MLYQYLQSANRSEPNKIMCIGILRVFINLARFDLTAPILWKVKLRTNSTHFSQISQVISFLFLCKDANTLQAFSLDLIQLVDSLFSNVHFFAESTLAKNLTVYWHLRKVIFFFENHIMYLTVGKVVVNMQSTYTIFLDTQSRKRLVFFGSQALVVLHQRTASTIKLKVQKPWIFCSL